MSCYRNFSINVVDLRSLESFETLAWAQEAGNKVKASKWESRKYTLHVSCRWLWLVTLLHIDCPNACAVRDLYRVLVNSQNEIWVLKLRAKFNTTCIEPYAWGGTLRACHEAKTTKDNKVPKRMRYQIAKPLMNMAYLYFSAFIFYAAQLA